LTPQFYSTKFSQTYEPFAHVNCLPETNVSHGWYYAAQNSPDAGTDRSSPAFASTSPCSTSTTTELTELAVVKFEQAPRQAFWPHLPCGSIRARRRKTSPRHHPSHRRPFSNHLACTEIVTAICETLTTAKCRIECRLFILNPDK
jgi:hypothetical protein